MRRSDLCDYSDAYINVKKSITVSNTSAQGEAPNKRNKKQYLKFVLDLLIA